MNRYKKMILTLACVIIMLVTCMFCVSAVGNDVYTKLCDSVGGIMSVAYRGDSASFPKNSLEGIMSAVKKGADMVSVSVSKTKDGVLVLCESGDLSTLFKTEIKSTEDITYSEFSKLYMLDSSDAVTEYKPVSLEYAVKKLDGKAILILDNAWDYYEEIAAKYDSSQVIIRTDSKRKQIETTVKRTNNHVDVIGIYKSNVIFHALVHMNRLTSLGMPVVQYQSKNYFNVMYGGLMTAVYKNKNCARAISPMYDADLCGQRTDNVNGYDEITERGFSVIETNNIQSLSQYIKQCDEVRSDLADIYDKAKNIDLSRYTQVSEKNIESAIKAAISCIENKNTPLGELESSRSLLIEAINDLVVKTQNDTQKGSLNITAGKVAAAIVFGSLLLLGEIYVFKMRKKEK